MLRMDSAIELATDDEIASKISEKIIDSINAHVAKPWISVEFFPPKTDAGDILCYS